MKAIHAVCAVLAATKRAAWAGFVGNGGPSTQVWTGFSGAHHCAFWAAAATTASH